MTLDRVDALGFFSWSLARNYWVLDGDKITDFTFHDEDVIWASEEAKQTGIELKTIYTFCCRQHRRGTIFRFADSTIEGLLSVVIEHFTVFE